MLFKDLDINGVYSYADYLKWHFEERVELIKGKIFQMSPAPNSNHQVISGRLFTEMMIFLKGKECHVFSAPFDVRLAKKTTDDKQVFNVVQPDICVICDRSKIDTKGCIGAPDIVVEIMSPANNKKELKNKYEIYEQSGVKEYWIVSPQDYTVLIYTLRDGAFVPSRLMVEGDIVSSEVLLGLNIDLSELFQALF
jgi:Uma2 family endonuclease